ncbi:DUF4139 domain-containing protein [Aurantimonas sp. VKM B-3413]|uniref:DUF4139 domain-containing protein n=1 Tax=Aurantimonas sp. VKM B-3413 TaxID=2779401 RepID=UPI001E2B2501|nr:DUF4139 domain-containing protein [Aurantimonas sp. VKM B-3413]MCB8840637.1 DUF4139 domain-containing protein [Aurantimonas sp. VKM B-3413]
MRIRIVVLAALMAGVAPYPLMAADGIRSVTLSSGGLAQVTRSQHVDGHGEIAVSVPFEQVDDVLKSLVVSDPSGTVTAMTLDGMDQAEETFRTLPFSPADMRSVPSLLGTIQGTRVRAESGGRTVEGKVLGVAEQNGGTENGTVQILSVLTGDGAIHTLPLGQDAIVTILDEAMLAKIADAALAAGKSKVNAPRVVAIRVQGEGERDVAVSYVVAAPIWKSAYRVVSHPGDRARLQAWAVIENATGEDWREVAVTLSSGAPVTLKQQLYKRYWRERPEVPVDVEANAVPEPDSGVISPAPKGGSRMARGMAAFAPPVVAAAPAMESMLDVSQATDTGTATEGDVSATYALPAPVDLTAGGTLSVPIVDAEVDAERVSVFQASTAGTHPIAALMISNDTGTSLPPGILTVYDERDGYVGDAQLLGVPAGETRMASFATDRKVEILSENRPDEAISSVRIVDGTARVEVRSRDVTTYTVRGAADNSRTVVIEHPRREGWTFTSEALDGSTASAHRLKVKLSAGETRTVRAVYETTTLQAYALTNANDALLTTWADSTADPATAEKLRALSTARAAATKAEREIDRLDQRAERVRRNQERVRDNLQAVPSQSELATKYLADMANQERELASLAADRDKAEAELQTANGEVAAIIRSF